MPKSIERNRRANGNGIWSPIVLLRCGHGDGHGRQCKEIENRWVIISWFETQITDWTSTTRLSLPQREDSYWGIGRASNFHSFYPSWTVRKPLRSCLLIDSTAILLPFTDRVVCWFGSRFEWNRLITRQTWTLLKPISLMSYLPFENRLKFSVQKFILTKTKRTMTHARRPRKCHLFV